MNFSGLPHSQSQQHQGRPPFMLLCHAHGFCMLLEDLWRHHGGAPLLCFVIKQVTLRPAFMRIPPVPTSHQALQHSDAGGMVLRGTA